MSGEFASDAENPYPDDCLLRLCRFTVWGVCVKHGNECPDCYCGTSLHSEPSVPPVSASSGAGTPAREET